MFHYWNKAAKYWVIESKYVKTSWLSDSRMETHFFPLCYDDKKHGYANNFMPAKKLWKQTWPCREQTGNSTMQGEQGVSIVDNLSVPRSSSSFSVQQSVQRIFSIEDEEKANLLLEIHRTYCLKLWPPSNQRLSPLPDYRGKADTLFSNITFLFVLGTFRKSFTLRTTANLFVFLVSMVNFH